MQTEIVRHVSLIWYFVCLLGGAGAVLIMWRLGIVITNWFEKFMEKKFEEKK